MKFAPVSSSNIHSVGYDPQAQVLEVKFHSGAHWRYQDVSPAAHEAMMAAESIGKHFNAHIRGLHAGSQVTQP